VVDFVDFIREEVRSEAAQDNDVTSLAEECTVEAPRDEEQR